MSEGDGVQHAEGVGDVSAVCELLQFVRTQLGSQQHSFEDGHRTIAVRHGLFLGLATEALIGCAVICYLEFAIVGLTAANK